MTKPPLLFHVPKDAILTHCRSCQEDVWWTYTRGGKRMQVNVKGAVRNSDDSHEGHSHFATCPHANSWRKRKAAPSGDDSGLQNQ